MEVIKKYGLISLVGLSLMLASIAFYSANKATNELNVLAGYTTQLVNGSLPAVKDDKGQTIEVLPAMLTRIDNLQKAVDELKSKK